MPPNIFFSVMDGVLHHVAGTYDGADGTVRLYVDGAQVGVSGAAAFMGEAKDDQLQVGCAKDETETLLAKKGVREFDLSGGRPMKGWLLVGPEGTGTAAGFKAWTHFALGRALQPQKTARKAVGRRPQTRSKSRA